MLDYSKAEKQRFEQQRSASAGGLRMTSPAYTVQVAPAPASVRPCSAGMTHTEVGAIRASLQGGQRAQPSPGPSDQPREAGCGAAAHAPLSSGSALQRRSPRFAGDIARSQNVIYNFNRAAAKPSSGDAHPLRGAAMRSMLENSFLTMSSLISKPVFNITPHKVLIHIFFFLVHPHPATFPREAGAPLLRRAGHPARDAGAPLPRGANFLSLNSKNLELLCANLSTSLKKPVELDLVRLYSPMNDSNILANVLGRISDITYKPYIFILDKIFFRAKIKPSFGGHGAALRTSFGSRSGSAAQAPSFITGIKIKLAGRLLKNKIIPRHTVKTTQHGSLTRSSAEIVSKARFTTKNKRGTFSITTSIGHRFF